VPAEDPEGVIQHVGRRIAELRERARLTQADVAERLETTVPNYQRIEHGTQNVTIRTMVKIAGILGARTGEFFAALESTEKRKRGRRPGRAKS
jgi:transcriptional regulator with XRE-family HTH domain